MFEIIIIGAVFISVASLIFGVGIMMRSKSEVVMEDRLAALTGNKNRNMPATELGRSLLSESINRAPSWVENKLAPLVDIRRFIDQSGMAISAETLLLISGGLTLAGMIAWAFVGVFVFLAPVIGLALGSIPFFVVSFKRKKRFKDFDRLLPQALELMSRALRAGHSLPAGFHLVAEQMSDPIGPEFARCYEEQNLGIPLEDALREMTKRIPNVDLRFFATAVIIQRQTGGDLAEILDKIGKLIRERFVIMGQVAALTGEGRLSGIVLLALPPFLFVVMLFINYDYVMLLFSETMGQWMLAGAIVFQILGALVIRKIVNIKV